jgi:hypothetical protein
MKFLRGVAGTVREGINSIAGYEWAAAHTQDAYRGWDYPPSASGGRGGNGLWI